MKRLTRTTALLLLFALSGCVSSKAFEIPIGKAAPLIARDVSAYPSNDVQRAEAANFKAAANDNPVTAATLKPAWDAVKGWYIPAYEADPLLDPQSKKLRRDNAERLDRVIAAELARPLGGH